MTEAEFKRIKTLTDIDGLSSKMIMAITKRSWGTISLIKRSENWEEYRAKTYAITHKPKPEPEAVIEQQLTEDEIQLMNSIGMSLKSVSEHMKLVTEHLRTATESWLALAEKSIKKPQE